jgi:hypothetical protein
MIMKEKDFEKYVEEYYALRETDSKPEINDENALLYSSLDNMDAIEGISFDNNIDITAIIQKGAETTLKSKDRKEFVLFLFSAFFIINIVFFACIYFNKNVFIYIQLIIAILLPFTLIPFSYYRTVKEGLK